MTAKDRSADRHDPDSQVQVGARIGREDFERLERIRLALGIPARRQVIIRALREFIDRNEAQS